MKERGMLFGAPMIRALLDGSKTQTRRAMAIQPDFPIIIACDPHTQRFQLPGRDPMTEAALLRECPHGKVGDRIYVRETFCAVDDRDEGGEFWYDYRATPRYSDIAPAGWHEEPDPKNRALKWTPSIHMPRAASRILLEIIGVRIERLTDISETDARAEGCSASGWMPSYSNPDNAGGGESISAADAFAAVWESVYGAGSWAANPFVWAISFKRVAP